LGHSLARFHSDLEEAQIPLRPGPGDVAAIVERARASDTIVVGTLRADAGQKELVHALLETGKPVVAVALREPYDLTDFPAVNSFVAAYSYAPAAMEALGEVLFGRIKPSGRLPVGIPGVADAGRGLTY